MEGKEPPHFLAMFGGKMTVFQVSLLCSFCVTLTVSMLQGGLSSAFETEAGEESRGVPDTFLLQVKGSSLLSCKAVEEQLSASSLNTNDCFVLVQGGDRVSGLLHCTVISKCIAQVSVWHGKGSTGDEREIAKSIALQRNPDPEIIFEGQERAEFWQALGGKQEYFDQKVFKQGEEVGAPRLFQVSNATGNITVEEIVEFGQEDLIEEDVMLLDAGHTVFCWFGAQANKQERVRGFS